MKLVGSGLGDDANLCPGAFAVFGGIGIAEDVEFSHGVDPQQLPAHASWRHRDGAGSGVFDSVQQEDVLVRLSAAHGKIVPFASSVLRPGSHGGKADGPGIESDEVVETPSVERQFFYLA